MWTKEECARVKAIVKRALVEAGYDCDMPSGTFSPENFRFTVKVFADRWQAKQEEWNRHCYKKGLTPDLFSRFFRDEDDNVFQIVEIAPRAPKYPVIAHRDDGKKYKFGAKYVKNRVALSRTLNERDVESAIKMIESR